MVTNLLRGLQVHHNHTEPEVKAHKVLLLKHEKVDAVLGRVAFFYPLAKVDNLWIQL